MSIITWWILFIIFGLLALHSLIKYFWAGITRYHTILMVVSIIIAAVSAGTIWG